MSKDDSKEEKNVMSSWRFHKYKKYESQYQPPDVVFKFVWAFLYTIYIFNLIKVRGNTALVVNLSIGLALNILWVIAFLFYKTPTVCFYILTVMIVLSVDAIVRMGNNDFVLEAVFQCFYLGWLAFAFYLNGVIVKNYNVDHKIKNIFIPSFKKDDFNKLISTMED